MSREGKLHTRHVASLAFAMTCAGPFGVEAAVRCFGAPAFFLGLFVTMLGYVLPQIFMTCELSMMPPLSNRGVVTWISRAFGGKAGECIGLNMLLYQIVDLATYTTVIVGYAESAGYEVHSGLPAIAPLLAISVGLCVNLLAVEMAAEVFMGVLALVLLPFLLGLRWSVPSLLGTNFWSGATVTQPSKDWNLFFSSLIWLNTGWDSFGNLAEEVAGPRQLLQGLLWAALAAFIVYLLCTWQALGAEGSWQDGYLAIAYRRFWQPLGIWVCISAALANTLLYTSELAVVARFLQSLGDSSEAMPQLLPSCFRRELSTGAPIVALLVTTALQLCLLLLTFDYLVQLSTLLHVVVYWWQLAAFLQLKLRHPELVRLYAVPGGRWGAALLCGLKAPVLVALVITGCQDWSMVLGALLVNVLFYFVVQCVK
ncbi:unnamed protein product [Durusdinium trenchii]|uniref:Amino acid transporter n=1 Tax=Durusdinium trenchii TaxID=1381693 RepID=A0ABP0IGN5_9DINO